MNPFATERFYPSSPLSLNIKPFLQCHRAVRRRILEKICWKLKVRPSFRQIEQIDHLAECGKNGAELHLAKGLRIFKDQLNLHFTWPFADSTPGGNKEYRGSNYHKPLLPMHIEKPGTYAVKRLKKILFLRQLDSIAERTENALIVDGDKVIFPLVLRPPLPGEKFHPSGMMGRKKINRFLSDCKIPRIKRHLYPVLACGSNVVAIPGLRVDQHFATGNNSNNFLEIDWTSTVNTSV